MFLVNPEKLSAIYSEDKADFRGTSDSRCSFVDLDNLEARGNCPLK